jgi:AcrR family transcriptional regulator
VSVVIWVGVATEVGLRERKKQRTRQALIEAAVRLFEENGYEATTVADIAAAAEVSTRTFFLHFPTKEALVFANGRRRSELGLGIISSPRQGESLRQLVLRAMREMIDDTTASDLQSGLGALRVRLLVSNPVLREAFFRGFFAAQAEFATALQDAYPSQLDPIDAAALVGAVLGAIYCAALRSVQQGDSASQVRDAMLRATEIAARCLSGPLRGHK